MALQYDNELIVVPRSSFSSLLREMPVSLLVAFAVGVFPLFHSSYFPGWHDHQRVAEALVLGIGMLLFSARWLGGHIGTPVVGRNVLLSLFGFFLFGLVSSFLAYSPRFAFYEWASFLLLLLLAWSIAEEIYACKEVMPLLICCGIGCAIYLFFEIQAYVSFIVVAAQPSMSSLISGFDNYRFFNHAQTVSLPLLGLLAFLNTGSRVRYWFWSGITAFWWALLFVSGGRGTMVGLAAGMAICLLVRREIALPWCRLMFRTGLAGLALYLFFYVLLPEWRGLQAFGLGQGLVLRTIDSPTSSRVPLWRLAWEMAIQHLWFGAGPLHFAHYGRTLGTAAHPHNWILQIASEWGFPALFFLTAAILVGGHALLRCGRLIDQTDKDRQGELAAWLAIGAAILVDGLVSGLIVMPVSQLWIVLYLGCAGGWVAIVSGSAGKVTEPSANRRASRVLVPIVVCGLLALFVNGLVPEIMQLHAREAEAAQVKTYSNDGRLPRIWRAGFF